MQPESLKVSILFGTGNPYAPLPEMLKLIPRFKLLGQAFGPEEFFVQHQATSPDAVLVHLDGKASLPSWLAELTHNFPQMAVLLCSTTLEPEFLIKVMQLGIREFLPLPLAQKDLEEALGRVQAAKTRLAVVPKSQGNIITVTGHKGGAGITTLAINLAMALAISQGERVAVVDLGRPFPDIGNFLDQEGLYNILDLVKNVHDLDQAFLQKVIFPYGEHLAILHGVADLKEQDNLDLDALSQIFAALRTMYHWVVVDLSHWLDDLFLHVIRESNLTLLLTAMSVPDLRNLRTFWPLLRDWGLNRNQVKIVVNRFNKGTSLELRDLEDLLNEKVFFTLPSDYVALHNAVNRGQTLMEIAPKSKLWRSFQDLAVEVLRTKGVSEPTGQAVTVKERSRKRFLFF